MTLSGIKCIEREHAARALQSSVTIEAALALPIFIFIFLSLSCYILALRTQETVQCCLINAADTMALQYYTVTDLKKVYQNSGGKVTDATGGTDVNDFYNTLEKYNAETSLNSYNIFGPDVKADRVDPAGLEAYVSNVWHMYEYMYKTKNNQEPMSGSSGLYLFRDYLLSEFYKRSYDFTNSGGSASASERKMSVDQLLNRYGIIGGFDGIQFSGVNAFEPQSGGNLITINIKYEFRFPFAVQGIGKIPIAQGVQVRAWGAGD